MIGGPGLDEMPLAIWMARCVLDIYRENVGSLAPLERATGIAVPSRLLQYGEAGGLSTSELRHLCGGAMFRVWAEINSDQPQAVMRPGDWRVVLYGLSGARTVRDAIQRSVDCFAAIDGRGGRMALRVADGRAELELDGKMGSPSLANCLPRLYGLGEFHSLLEWLIGQRLPIIQVNLAFEAEIFAEVGIPPLPFPLKMGAEWTGFTFPAAFLDYPTTRRDEDVLSHSTPSFLFDAPTHDAWSDAAGYVRHFAHEVLRREQHLPTLDEVAVAAGISPATLRRRLALQKTNYRDIKESCRREFALKLLRFSDQSMEEIAARLDYCDSDAFRRAFRSWMGMSPLNYRNASHS